jgi:hypothetical protein
MSHVTRLQHNPERYTHAHTHDFILHIQEIRWLSYNPMVHRHHHHLSNGHNPWSVLENYFFKIHYNIMQLEYYIHFPMHDTHHTDLNIPDLLTLTISSEEYKLKIMCHTCPQSCFPQ